MKLSSYLDSKFIFTDFVGTKKDQIINEIIEKLSNADESFQHAEDKIKDAILQREHEITTAMGRGIAIPHARIKGYEDLIVGIGVLKNPVKCQTITKAIEDVNIFFVIVAGQTKNKLMLKLMAALMKLAMKKELLEEIASGINSEKIFNLIEEADIVVEDRITAENLMNSEIKPAKITDSLEEMAKRFSIENLQGLPVVDDNGKFLGEITERELIQYGMPKYTSIMADLSFMTVGEPFEEYFKNEKLVTVKELYRKNSFIIDRKASIMEISFSMVTKGVTRMYVVEDGKYFGTIFRSYIIKKVLHV